MLDINEYIARLDWHREPSGLYEPISYALATGGKRLRPTLAVLATEMFGGRTGDVIPAALALEVFHNFTLLHDDLMDNADMRRSRPTVHRKWNANTAILSGDQMMIEAYRLLAQVPADKLQKCLQLFNKMATEICEGQQYDVDFEQQDEVTLDNYLMMIRLKTSVLLATALQMGAYIAGADEKTQQSMYNIGIHIGLAFQIQDDLLDVYGNPATFGKAIGGDICQGKKTYLWLTALSLADPEALALLRANCKPLPIDATDAVREERINLIRGIYDRLGVRQQTEQAILMHSEAAKQIMAKLPDNEANAALLELTNHLVIRKN